MTVPVDLYRPSEPLSVVLVLFPDVDTNRTVWSAVAESLRAHRVSVAAVDLRRAPLGGSAAPVWGRLEDPMTPWTQGWREASAALETVSAAVATKPLVVLGGVGLGADAAVIAASRLPSPPDALVLIQPANALAGIPTVPVLAGLDMPLFIASPMEDGEEAEAARDLFLATRRRAILRQSGQARLPASAFLGQPELAVDLMEWLEGLLPRLLVTGGAEAGGGEAKESAP